jgi:two-component system sensor histidine kinase KdpD
LFPDGFGPGLAPPDERDAETRAEERILIHITNHPHTAALIRRARRVADYLQAECLGVVVSCPNDRSDAEAHLQKHLSFARNLHIDVEVVQANDVAQAVVDFARKRNATQIYVSGHAQQPWKSFFNRSMPQQIVRLARDKRVVIVSDRG